MRDDNEPYFEDEEYIEPLQSKKNKKRASSMVWMAVGAAGLVIMGGILLFMVRPDGRRTQAMMMKLEAHEAARQARQKASMPMAAQSSREDLEQRQIDSLIGSRLESIRDDGGVWTFTSVDFVLEAGRKPLPEDLLQALLGPQRSASRIEGKWKIDEENRLRLTDIRGDGKTVLKEAQIGIEAHQWNDPAGTVRMFILGHEYNIFHDTVEKK